jgi:hypothetical protein
MYWRHISSGRRENVPLSRFDGDDQPGHQDRPRLVVELGEIAVWAATAARLGDPAVRHDGIARLPDVHPLVGRHHHAGADFCRHPVIPF